MNFRALKSCYNLFSFHFKNITDDNEPNSQLTIPAPTDEHKSDDEVEKGAK